MRQQGAYDKLLLLATLMLVGFGVLMVYSSTSVVTPLFAKRNISSFFYVKRHALTLLLGLAFMFAASRIKLDTLKKLAIPLLIVSFVLLILVFVPKIGLSAGGATRS